MSDPLRVFLDTNILLDIIQNRPGLASTSLAVLERCDELQAECFIAWHGLATAYYILKRGRTQAEAMAEVDKILLWADIAPISKVSAHYARSLHFADFEDAMQAAAAKQANADLIVTRNTKDFIGSPVRAYSPEHFLQLQPHGIATE